MVSYKARSKLKQLLEQFPNWHVGDWEEEWPDGIGDESLTSDQLRIVENNTELLLDRNRWIEETQKFENGLAAILNADERERVRSEFQIRFDKYEFNNASFRGYFFPCFTSFSGTVFKDTTVEFNRSIFKEGVSFDGAKFLNSPANFHGMIVQNGDFYFNNVHVENRVINFFKAQFLGDIAEFNFMVLKKAGFTANEVKVTGHLFIKNTRFPCVANFQRLSVGGACDLSKNTFNKVPDFTSSIFDRPPDVSGVEVLAFKGVNILELWSWPCWKAEEDESAKFRKLKAMALAANDHEKDGEFFAYEMLAKRGHDEANKGRFALFLNWLYFTFSNFGQSYLRPAIALGFNFLMFFVINAITAASFLKPSDLSSFAFWQSFKNMIPFLNSLIRFASRPDDFKSTYELAFNQLKAKDAPIEFFINAGIVQNFIGLVLLFLLLLGLRNKFRLK